MSSTLSVRKPNANI